MHHFILIFGFVLLPKVATLKCYECLGTSGTCDITKECPASETRCGVLRITTSVASLNKADAIIMKSCTDHCINGSMNFGVVRNVITSKCCTSDLCNTQSVPEPAKSNPNGRKCHTCIGQSCDHVLNCEGSEDHCISASVTLGGQSMTMKGCISADICAHTDDTIFSQYGQKVVCCQGDYCNSASTSSTSLLVLLVAPFIPLITLS